MENNKTSLENKRAAMEKRKALIEKRKKEIKRRKILTLLTAIVMVVLGVAVGFVVGRDSVPDDVIVSSQTADDGLSIMSTTESGEWVTVKTSYMTIRYPFAFSDIIEVEAYNEEFASQLRFYVYISGKKTLNYVIHFNSDEGLPCGTLKLQNDIPVSVEFKKASDRLSEDWLSTFYAVQETFNDVLKSMEENEKFFGVDS